MGVNFLLKRNSSPIEFWQALDATVSAASRRLQTERELQRHLAKGLNYLIGKAGTDRAVWDEMHRSVHTEAATAYSRTPPQQNTA